MSGEPQPVLITLTRADASAKGLIEGRDVWVKPVAGASRVKLTGAPAVESLTVPEDAASLL